MMDQISKIIAVGSHHDTITGTSKELVHNDEKIKFTKAISDLEIFLANLYADFFNFKTIEAATTPK